MSYLIKERFIDDSRYASAFVKDKFRQNKWGKVKISAHLRSKSLGDDLIRSALDEIDDEAYIDMIREVINDHRRLVKAKNQYDMKGKLLRFALSRGYESHLVYDILNESDQ
jgi:regulatory protein